MTGQVTTVDDDGMTPDQRLEWLRERGVQITTPEERRASQIKGALRQAEALEEEEEVAYVLVPADKSQPLQQLTFRPRKKLTSANKFGGGADLLAEYLKPAFSGKADQVDLTLLQQGQASTTLAAHGAPAQVSEDALRQVAKEGNVEVFTLVHPTEGNKYTGINIYLDEVGMLKRLPLNTRASDYAAAAGFNPPPQFYGDVFVGRVEKRPTHRHVSFVLGPDTAMDAAWLRSAAAENLQRQLELNKITGRNDQQQPGPAGSDGKFKQEDGFSWTQTEQDLEVTVPIPSSATPKQVDVKFKPQNVTVLVNKTPTLALALFERVDIDSCTWTLEKNSGDGETKKLILSMEKVEPAFWPRILD